MPNPQPADLLNTRDNAAADAWFRSTDELLDSITEVCMKNLEFFRIASPYERLTILRGQLHWLVDEFFKPAIEATRPSKFTPDERQAWRQTIKEAVKTP